MIELSDRDYESLVAARNEFGEALEGLIRAAESHLQQGPEEPELMAATAAAREVLRRHGVHKAFVVF